MNLHASYFDDLTAAAGSAGLHTAVTAELSHAAFLMRSLAP
jgi:hypothetical protein